MVAFRSEAVNQLTFVEVGPERSFVYARSYDFCLALAQNRPIFCVATVTTSFGVGPFLFSSPLRPVRQAFCGCIHALCRSKLWVSAYQKVEDRTLSIPRTKNCLRP